MKDAIERTLGQVLLCGLVLGAAACGAHVSLGEDQGASGGGTGGAATSNGNGAAAAIGGNVGGASTGPVGSMPSCSDQTDADTWIAFDSDRDRYDRELYLVHPDGSGLTRLTTRPGIDQEPAFSPDGKWLSFTSDRDGSLQIYLLELATGDVTQVTHHEGGADQSTFSHDSKLLAFHSGASTYTIFVDGTNERLVASGPDPYNGYAHPQFTLDDTQVVVDRNNEIDVFTLDGNAQRMIVQNWTTTIQAPSLSPSGLDVVYEVYCDGVSLWSSPFSVNTNPCEGVRITPGDLAHDSRHPSWGPNDRIVYSRVDKANNTGQIVTIVRERDAKACAVTALGADDRNPVWSLATK
jgi:Tol biopolymer transport system component